MRKKQLSSRIKALSTEKKVMGIASVITLISCFLPWYGINSRVINEWWNAFSSIGSVAGYLIAAFSLITFTMIAIEVIKPELNFKGKLPIKESALLLFLSAQSFFVALIFIPVYAQYSLINATSSGSRFGIYLALISTLVSTVFALSHQRRGERAPLEQDVFQVPRTQRSVGEWSEEEGTTEQETVAQVEEEQEMMFHDQGAQQSFREPEETPSHQSWTNRP